MSTLNSGGLTIEGCRKRQARLRERLARRGLAGALLTESRYVHYFCGQWVKYGHYTAALILTDGPTVLSTPRPPGEVAADEVRQYTASKLATQVDDRRPLSLELLRDLLPQDKLGCDWAVPQEYYPHATAGLYEDLRALRRTKDPDEVALLRRAIAGTEAAYARAKEILQPGVSEVRIYAEMVAAAEAVGEPLGEMGNDFTSGRGDGGPPRDRAVQTGELIPLDVSVWVRGYSCDLCRTFSVDGKPTAAQQEAHAALVSALGHVRETVRPGASCLELYNEVYARLNTSERWTFPHHLGHGIGMSPHEAPRLNPNWDDTFQPGDVFTAEPGLYAEELNTGIRLEENYLVTETGVEQLSSFPLDL